jgi:Skp family chaperone for outer membrane proteins
MPNPLGRRRISSASTEVEQLKKELTDLRAAYVQDMQNISNDMTNLSQKIEPSSAVDTEVVS